MPTQIHLITPYVSTSEREREREREIERESQIYQTPSTECQAGGEPGPTWSGRKPCVHVNQNHSGHKKINAKYLILHWRKTIFDVEQRLAAEGSHYALVVPRTRWRYVCTTARKHSFTDKKLADHGSCSATCGNMKVNACESIHAQLTDSARSNHV